MIEHVLTVGTNGELKIEDKTDDPATMMVELWIKALPTIAVPQLPWAYSRDGVMSSWQAFNFQDISGWQRLGGVYAGGFSSFTLHLGDTGTTELDGPADLAISLYGAPTATNETVHVRVDGVYKKAVPYVRHEGVWKVAKPYVRTFQGWKETS